ncbi:hypothetical protein SP90_01335 [Halodesulfovibrio spirochaetisodalis]|uniref:Anti-bacteriophage protein A/HamA C-terminal domain-containing protein n=2 Tax=Halodesulfovibrio spirochaetisodalis TaxID=1560234 RepID=A0A1B7XN12_9BACT|nr:hypothetical protein SP90_01335 [Halodesulfovibrio spirochaetisodalis]
MLGELLRDALRGKPSSLDAHLICHTKDLELEETKTRLHCYYLPTDANGRIRIKPLAEHLRDRVIDYAIPRKTAEEARRVAMETNSLAPISALHERAKNLFTDLAKSGEGGELLLFAMAESIFGITQVICKMTLKTSTSMHYHGSDGVYVEARPEGGLNLYWGESKVYQTPSTAISNCLESLAPFLLDEEGEDAERNQDILLVNEFANFTDEHLIAGLKEYLDKNNPKSLLTKHCGFALTAFDSHSYPHKGAAASTEDVSAALAQQLKNWKKTTKGHIKNNKLEHFDIHFICVPMPCVEDFRSYFLKIIGVSNDT